jgi:Asp-tRNA(Asn)/Glu-tRNA(Gln) amidotransferase A subunit family amidase
LNTLSWSAIHLAQEIASGALTSKSYCRALIDRIQANTFFNAFATFNADLLLERAIQADADQKAGKNLGPLHGVPLIIKDNINTIDFPTSGGTPALKGNVPRSDAPLVARLRNAGALLAGKANLHELSSGGTSANHTFGPVRNPYATTHTPGGSSGGTAAAVAAFLSPAGIGTDTMGSVRVPASLCGLFGFRPTVGRYSADGIIPLSSSFDSAGPLARTMDDIVLLDRILSASGSTIPIRDINTIRLGIAEDLMAETTEDSMAVINRVLADLGAEGIVLKPVNMNAVRAVRNESAIDVMDVEFKDLMRDYLEEHAPHVKMHELAEAIGSPSAKTFTVNRLLRTHDPAVYQQSITAGRLAYDTAWQTVFDDANIDAIAFPTTSDVALPLAEDDFIEKNGEPVHSWFYFRHTSLGSHARCPCISLPIGLSSSGLPVGLEIDGLPGHDEALLSTARAITTVLAPLPPPPVYP